MLDFLNNKGSSFLGLDLGASGVKAVKLSSEGSGVVLRDYVSFDFEKEIKAENNIYKQKNAQLLNPEIHDGIKTVLDSIGADKNKVAMSVPASSTFSSVITLPNMEKGLLDEAVNFEAKKYIPVPMEEVVFGWSIVSSPEEPKKKEKDEKKDKKDKKDKKEKENKIDKDDFTLKRERNNLKVLLIAIPREISMKYLEIANSFDLDLMALETESFSLNRALVSGRKGVFFILDIGYRMTSMTVVDDGMVVESHNIPSVGGEEFTKVISNSFGVDKKRAEVMKKQTDSDASSLDKMSDIIRPILGILVSEIKKNNEIYYKNNGKKADGIILTGGSSGMPGITEYLKEELEMDLSVGNPFKNIAYNSILEDKIKIISPSFSISVGLALRGFEKK